MIDFFKEVPSVDEDKSFSDSRQEDFSDDAEMQKLQDQLGILEVELEECRLSNSNNLGEKITKEIALIRQQIEERHAMLTNKPRVTSRPELLN